MARYVIRKSVAALRWVKVDEIRVFVHFFVKSDRSFVIHTPTLLDHVRIRVYVLCSCSLIGASGVYYT